MIRGRIRVMVMVGVGVAVRVRVTVIMANRTSLVRSRPSAGIVWCMHAQSKKTPTSA